MSLVDSLLTAMVRADGDALVMHVGERPIVVSGSRTIDLSAHGMNLSAMVGMLGQLLSGDALAALKDDGAVEHALPSRDGDLFSVVAARGGDDIWIEIRRRRESSPNRAAGAMLPAPAAAESEPAMEPQPAAVVTVLSGSSSSVSLVQAPAASQVLPMDPIRPDGPPPDVPSPSHSPPPLAPPSAPPAAENGTPVSDLPMTRTVRIEVPARVLPPSRPAGVDQLLRVAAAAGASELFLVSQARPYVRVAGSVRALQDETPLLPEDIDAMVAEVTPEPSGEAVRRGDPAEWLIELAEIGRVRCSTFRDHRGPGANFQFALLRAVTADDLQLSAEIRLLATESDGLILVAGGPGSDTSAIVAALMDLLNGQRADYIISLEPQIRALHANREALVSQREVGQDSARAVAAARAALRETPDVLVVEGVATDEMARLVIEAASHDRLVIASLEAPSAGAAVQRLVELLPADDRWSARAALARSFRGALAQLLLRKTTGGRIAARELLTGTRTIAGILAEGDLTTLGEALDRSAVGGTGPLAAAIVEYVRAGVVDAREATRKAPDAPALIERLRAAGVDVGLLEACR